MVSTPSFWTSIRIFPSNESYKEDKLLSRLSELAGRTGILPLHIIWHYPAEIEAEIAVKIIDHLFRLISTSRWKKVTISGSNSPRSLPLCAVPQGERFTILEALEVLSENVDDSILDLFEATGAKFRRLKAPKASLPKLATFDIFKSLKELDTYQHLNSEVGFTTGQLSLFGWFPELKVLHLDSLRSVSTVPLSKTLTRLYIRLLRTNQIEIITGLSLRHLHVDHLTGARVSSRPIFPTLQSLQVATGDIWSLLTLNIPELERLKIGSRGVPLNTGTDSMTKILEEPTYSLSPKSAMLVLPVNMKALACFLRRSEFLEDLTFSLDRYALGEAEELIGAFSRPKIDGKVQEFNSPQLRTLRIMLRWCQVGSGRLTLIPTASCRDIAEHILEARAGTPLSSVTFEWDDGYEIAVHVTTKNPWHALVNGVAMLQIKS